MSVNVGQSYQVIWDSAFTGGTTVSGPGLSSTQLSGTQTIVPITAGVKTYNISGGGQNGSVAVNVNDPDSHGGSPWVWIDAAPKSCYVGDEVLVVWNSANVSASVSGPGLTSGSASGQFRTTFSSTGTKTYNIVGGGQSDSVAITVNPRPPTTPSTGGSPYVTITASPKSVKQGDNVTIGWDSNVSANVTSDSPSGTLATNSNGGGSATRNTAGWPAPARYWFYINGPNGESAQDYVDITVKPKVTTPVTFGCGEIVSGINYSGLIPATNHSSNLATLRSVYPSRLHNEIEDIYWTMVNVRHPLLNAPTQTRIDPNTFERVEGVASGYWSNLEIFDGNEGVTRYWEGGGTVSITAPID